MFSRLFLIFEFSFQKHARLFISAFCCFSEKKKMQINVGVSNLCVFFKTNPRLNLHTTFVRSLVTRLLGYHMLASEWRTNSTVVCATHNRLNLRSISGTYLPLPPPHIAHNHNCAKRTTSGGGRNRKWIKTRDRERAKILRYSEKASANNAGKRIFPVHKSTSLRTVTSRVGCPKREDMSDTDTPSVGHGSEIKLW